MTSDYWLSSLQAMGFIVSQMIGADRSVCAIPRLPDLDLLSYLIDARC